jgi:hypothetical protein
MSIVTISSQEFKFPDHSLPKERVGPDVPLNFRIWKTLVDYSRWNQWMDDVHDVTLNDPITKPSSDFGRGSTFHLYGSSGVQTLQILHWSPCQKFVYCITSAHPKIAHSYEIHLFPELQQASVTVSGEIEIRGIKRLVSFFITRRHKRILGRQGQRLAVLISHKQ